MAKIADKRKYRDRRDYLIRAVHARRKKIRQMAVEYKGGKCEICGYDQCIESLDFHHRDKTNKDFSISSKGYTRSWNRVMEELDKCIIVCANCHRELHANVSSFNGKPLLKKRVNSGNSRTNGTILSQALDGKVQRLDTRCLSPKRYGKGIVRLSQ